MKKYNYLILLIILFMPFIVSAKESCTIVSGNGKDIGSEVACGSEHFYIIENKNDNLKMLSKYNLYVGANYNKITVDSTKTYMKRECTDSSCDDYNYNNTKYYFDGVEVSSNTEWESKFKEKYNLSALYNINYELNYSDGTAALYGFVYGDSYVEGDKTYKNVTYKLYPYTTMVDTTEGYELQNELARGVVGDKGNATYPIYATLTLFPSNFNGYNSMDSVESYDNFLDGYTNFKFKDDSYINNYLKDYKSILNDKGYEISSIDMISISEINELVNRINGKNLPLANWYNNSYALDPEDFDSNPVYNLGDLKEYLSDEYKWLWNTSYWTNTFVGNVTGNSDVETLVYFVSSSGDICYSYSSCGGIPRAGLRPVVTMNKSNIKYKIFTKTDGNGTIEVVDTAFGGDSISFRVSAKKGLRLAGLTVITDSGEKVEFREEDLTTNADGTISISTNKFTMPFENVTIEARWRSDLLNPNTGMIYPIIVLIIMVMGISTYTYIKKRKA